MNKENIVYIALLRGINVGGHTVKMDVLRGLFLDLGFENVRSFIQTGNIFFENRETNTQVLRNKIEKHLQTSLGYTVAVFLRTVEELDHVVNQEPFKKIQLTADTRFVINFLAEPVTEHLSIPYKTSDGAYEVIAMTPSELFVVWHLKNGRPGNSYGDLEKKIKVPVTTRFWHTTIKILAAAKK